MFTGLYADTSKIIENVSIDTIKENYATPFKQTLKNIIKRIVLNNKEYIMRGIVAFSAPVRKGLRSSISGHYTTYAYRPNDRWELYDDCKDKMINASQNYEANIELIIFTV